MDEDVLEITDEPVSMLETSEGPVSVIIHSQQDLEVIITPLQTEEAPQDASITASNSVRSSVSPAFATVVESQKSKAQVKDIATKPLPVCPLSKEFLRDPMVHPNGISYEREVVEEQLPKVACYPNRALRDYLDPDTNPQIELRQASCPGKKDLFYCRLSGDLFRCPVIDKDGNTYEREFILKAIREGGISPFTKNPLVAKDLYLNVTLYEVLCQAIMAADESINPEDIRDWKNDVSKPWWQRASKTKPAAATVRRSSQTEQLQAQIEEPAAATVRRASQFEQLQAQIEERIRREERLRTIMVSRAALAREEQRQRNARRIDMYHKLFWYSAGTFIAIVLVFLFFYLF